MRSKELGNAIRKRRIERGLKVFQLATYAVVDPVYITQIEKHGKLPSPAVMERISSALANRDLLVAYLKIKYPVLYEEREKLFPDLNPAMEGIFKEIRRKNKTPQEQKALEERMVAFHQIFTRDKEELERTIKILDIIEKITISLKKKAKQEGKLKESNLQAKAVEKAHQRKF